MLWPHCCQLKTVSELRAQRQSEAQYTLQSSKRLYKILQETVGKVAMQGVSLFLLLSYGLTTGYNCCMLNVLYRILYSDKQTNRNKFWSLDKNYFSLSVSSSQFRLLQQVHRSTHSQLAVVLFPFCRRHQKKESCTTKQKCSIVRLFCGSWLDKPCSSSNCLVSHGDQLFFNLGFMLPILCSFS